MLLHGSDDLDMRLTLVGYLFVDLMIVPVYLS
jgi:hypothetical protein